MGSQGLTKGSLMFLNYPAQILFKFTKVFHLSFHFVMVAFPHSINVDPGFDLQSWRQTYKIPLGLML